MEEVKAAAFCDQNIAKSNKVCSPESSSKFLARCANGTAVRLVSSALNNLKSKKLNVILMIFAN